MRLCTFEAGGRLAPGRIEGDRVVELGAPSLADWLGSGGADIAEHALEALRHSAIEEVVVLGRRGPEHAAFTTPELLALGSLPEVDVTVHGGYEAPEGASVKLRTIAEYARRVPRQGRRRITLRFHGAPVEILGGDGVEGIRIAPGLLMRSPAVRTATIC